MAKEENAQAPSGVSEAHQDIASMSFEAAMNELEQVIRKLESSERSLEDALGDYARGTALKAHCQKQLDEAKLKVEKIMQGEQGAYATQPLDG